MLCAEFVLQHGFKKKIKIKKKIVLLKKKNFEVNIQESFLNSLKRIGEKTRIFFFNSNCKIVMVVHHTLRANAKTTYKSNVVFALNRNFFLVFFPNSF
jgi:hypothetical protein